MKIPTRSIPAAEYHAASRRGEYMSSHLLADFRESPEFYRRKISGENAANDGPALAPGRGCTFSGERGVISPYWRPWR